MDESEHLIPCFCHRCLSFFCFCSLSSTDILHTRCSYSASSSPISFSRDIWKAGRIGLFSSSADHSNCSTSQSASAAGNSTESTSSSRFLRERRLESISAFGKLNPLHQSLYFKCLTGIDFNNR